LLLCIYGRWTSAEEQYETYQRMIRTKEQCTQCAAQPKGRNKEMPAQDRLSASNTRASQQNKSAPFIANKIEPHAV
jgi:hypothetical protein